MENLPAVQEMWVQSLGQDDPLEKELETHYGILAWEIPWTEEHGGLWSMQLQGLYTTQGLNHHHQTQKQTAIAPQNYDY